MKQIIECASGTDKSTSYQFKLQLCPESQSVGNEPNNLNINNVHVDSGYTLLDPMPIKIQ